MALASNADFADDPEQWAGNVLRDIERLYDLVGGGTTDGNVSAVPVTQANTQVNIQNGDIIFNSAPGTGSSGGGAINLTFPGGNTVTIGADDFAGFSGLQVRLRVLNVCESGVTRRILALASQSFP